MDESGKGDFFGPLSVASVFLPHARFNEFKKAGVMDSKKISDKKVLMLDALIQKNLPCKTIVVGPEKYNTLYQRFQNLNILLGWAHAAALRDLSAICPAKKALLDQFASRLLVESQLKKMGVSILLEQRPRAESDLAVACASIVARACFLKQLKALSENFSMEFPKGAGAPVNTAAKVFVERFGPETLKQVAKMHFKNALPFRP
jgi:ribonuclease HIII